MTTNTNDAHALKGARVLIVGGSSGIGLATALSAQALGARVTIASRSATRLASAMETLEGQAGSAVLDTRDAGAVEKFFTGQEEWDHVVVSAAQTPGGPVRDLPLDQARSAVESKFWGAYHVARAAKLAEKGSLTFVSGFLSVRPSASSVLQGGINAALEGLARGLALELAPARVNTVSPGLIDTPLWQAMDEAKRHGMFERVSAQLPARRIGTAQDIAQAIIFLMSNGFATGSSVRVDGGGAIG
ncbi:SDR family oxidoreductase [Asaia krungthepensis]|uniref:Dehydrogenase n=1 Tax=Asaia krungthepensis NRIC 0535 TaxID=1307925 RepID=A0ABQ0Q4T4_9PROT|nr:SDR family oxidoreductase [Asaia krungthepensis]GBQ91467.1 dehydrogenase [Asaia krungthepensis NRIC 0535]